MPIPTDPAALPGACPMKKDEHPYLSLAFLTGLNLFNYLDRFVLPSVLKPLQADLHLSDGQAGSANTAFMIGYFCTSPFFGYLGDRFPRKWLIAIGILFWSLGTTLSSFSTGLVTLLAYRILVGLGEASYATLAPAWISDLFSAERRNNALTIFYVAIPVGSALGFIVGGFALSHGGWRPAFLWAGAPGLVLALLLLFLREPARGEADREDEPAASTPADPGKKPTFADVLHLFKLGDFNLVLLGYTAYTFALGAFGFWAASFLSRVHGMELEKADHFFGPALVLTGLVGTLLGGFLATAWQKRNRAGYALVLTLSTALAVPAAAAAFLTHDTFLSKVFLVLSMFLLFVPTGPINTLIVESVPAVLRASAMAASIFVIHLLGDFWSPQIIGYLSDRWNDPANPATGLRTAVLVLPAVLVLATAFWAWLAWRKHRQTSGIVPTRA